MLGTPLHPGSCCGRSEGWHGERQYQSPNPISLGRFFSNNFASSFFFAGKCQGLTFGPELLSEAMDSLRSIAVKSHEETPHDALLPEKYLPSAPLCGLIKAF